jgi:hypothetical protein
MSIIIDEERILKDVPERLKAAFEKKEMTPVILSQGASLNFRLDLFYDVMGEVQDPDISFKTYDDILAAKVGSNAILPFDGSAFQYVKDLEKRVWELEFQLHMQEVSEF